ncbi:hypothetical protein FGO68_gene11318 [Halteria grandinella]|uniref:Uncharacterized protein n=1 Tax=Halteria grandinella TaxID=5974 RepID=A0A8J8T8Q9_HALGN|nr:hypothetical protein FGO68_gene11318 [Halteria grandinella]
MFSSILQLIAKPMDSYAENAICLFNELMATIYLYVLIGLAIASDDIVLRENIGLGLISILLFSLLVNLLKVLIMMIIQVIKKIKQKVASSNYRIRIIRKPVHKFPSSMPNITEVKKYELEEYKEEEKEEIKEEFKDEEQVQQQKGKSKKKKKFKKKKAQSRWQLLNEQNETKDPTIQTISRSMCVEDIEDQKYALFRY